MKIATCGLLAISICNMFLAYSVVEYHGYNPIVLLNIGAGILSMSLALYLWDKNDK